MNAINHFEQQNSKGKLLAAKNNLGVYYLFENKPLKAMPYLLEFKKYLLALNEKHGIAQNYGNLGYAYGLLKTIKNHLKTIKMR